MNVPFKRPTISQVWATTSKLPLGNRLFSRFVGRMAPYTGTVGATVLELTDGYCRAELRDRPAVRNHLSSVHAVALMNLGELTTGLAVMHAVDGRGRGIVTDLRMEYLKKARGTITATCSVDLPSTAGRHDLEVAGDLRDAQGEVVARVWATWRLDLRGEEGPGWEAVSEDVLTESEERAALPAEPAGHEHGPGCDHGHEEDVVDVSPAEVKARLERGDALVLLDCREPEELARASLPDVLHVPLRELPSRLPELDPEAEYVVVCHHGIRSANAAAFLKAHDFPRVLNLRGGIDAWSREVDPAVPTY